MAANARKPDETHEDYRARLAREKLVQKVIGGGVWRRRFDGGSRAERRRGKAKPTDGGEKA